jgi:hypothetical protein
MYTLCLDNDFQRFSTCKSAEKLQKRHDVAWHSLCFQENIKRARRIGMNFSSIHSTDQMTLNAGYETGFPKPILVSCEIFNPSERNLR